MNKDIANSIISKIKKENLHPIPKWRCYLYHGIFWLIFGIAALIGAKALGVILLFLNQIDIIAFGPELPHMIPVWIGLLPFFWLILFTGLLILATYGLQHTRKGYKHTIKKIVVLNLLLSGIIGITSFQTGLAQKFEDIVHKNIPIIEHHQNRQHQVWVRPSEGRIAGKIIRIENDNKIIVLEDFGKKSWTINTATAILKRRVKLEPQVQIKVIGIQMDPQTFQAEMIAPWRKMRR
jgi:hypothetical protein